MPDNRTVLQDGERSELLDRLKEICGRLDEVGELLAAVHIAQAVDFISRGCESEPGVSG